MSYVFRVETIVDMVAVLAVSARCILTKMMRVKARGREHYREIEPGNEQFQWSTMVKIHSRSISRPFGKVNILRKF